MADRVYYPEWYHEPDHCAWIDPSTNYLCCVLRNATFKCLNGYVAYSGIGVSDRDVSVHGGITYQKTGSLNEFFNIIGHQNIPEGFDITKMYNIMGFDTGYYGDFVPGNVFIGSNPGDSSMIYRNMEYVKNECTSLARQIYQIIHS